jgi:sarcosine oxidase subunit delta
MLLIACPFCGERPEDEFGFGGDATVTAPDQGSSPESYADYLYLRDNIKGRQAELWVHRFGCRRWLVVERDTLSHEIFSVRLAGGGAAG